MQQGPQPALQGQLRPDGSDAVEPLSVAPRVAVEQPGVAPGAEIGGEQDGKAGHREGETRRGVEPDGARASEPEGIGDRYGGGPRGFAAAGRRAPNPGAPAGGGGGGRRAPGVAPRPPERETAHP